MSNTHSVIAKMRVSSNVENPFDGRDINLYAVHQDSEENKSFSKATPSASLSMTISNPDAYDYFIEGKEYFVRFERADTSEGVEKL